jgi:Disulphide bond corrector protein DsbC
VRILGALIGLGLSLGPAAAASRVVVRLEPPAPVAVTAARSVKVPLTFLIRDGYHVQANPASADYLRPVLVKLAGGCGVAPASPVYPAAERYRLEGADSDLATYSGKFTVTVALSVAGGRATGGDCSLSGTLQYQACDAKTCLAPTTLTFTVPVSIR